MIDFFGQTEFYKNYKKDINAIIEDVLSNESLLRGESLESFEDEIKKFIGRKYAIAVNSGTDAILIALKSLGVKENDEIIVPAFSFVASATPIKLLGAKPIFVDVDEETGLIDLDLIQDKITKKTKGMIVVDLFGECPDYDYLSEFCTRNKIFLLEDGAQSLGAKYKNKYAGNFGIVSTISFDVSKIMFGVTTGGVILTNDEKIYQIAKQVRGHGFSASNRDFELLGYNSNMSTLNASILSYRMKYIEDFSNKRQFVRNYYDNGFKTNKNITLLKRNDYSIGNNHKYVIIVKNREKLIKYLNALKIPTKIHYNMPIPNYGCFKQNIDVPNSIFLSKNILSLPIHPFLSEKDLKFIVESINKFYE